MKAAARAFLATDRAGSAVELVLFLAVLGAVGFAILNLRDVMPDMSRAAGAMFALIGML